MKTFKYALQGILFVFKNERNFIIHTGVAVLVIAAGIFFKINRYEWFAVIFAVTTVTAFEMLNSALEYICDFISPDYNDKIKIVKDASAGAVLISATGAFILGMIIFIPKIIEFINNP